MASTSSSLAWHLAADVVVVGSGACGIPAAIVAREMGARVVVVEAQDHMGGHAMISGGNVPLGGGTSVQKKYGIADTPDLLFRDLTDWSVVGANGFPDYRYNDREIVRAFCRQQRRDLRVAPGARRHLRRQGAGRARRQFGRQFGAARDALRGAGLAHGADRQAAADAASCAPPTRPATA